MTVADEKFFAWLDGELTGAEAAAVEAAVAGDPELTRRAEQHRALSRTLRAFDEVASAPVPDRIAAAATTPSADLVDFANASRRPQENRRYGGPPAWMGMAAALALGLLLGLMLRAPGLAPFETESHGVYAAASLKQALDTQLASTPGAGNVRIGLTFRDRNGDICRSFTLRGSAGLACRDDGRWNVRGLFGGPESGSGEYRMASGSDPNQVALIESSMAGEPFDQRQERAAQRNGWR